MMAFQSAIDDCELRDMGFLGDQFTWYRGRTRERLDRGLINNTWSIMYPHAALQNLGYNHSDHRPLLVDTKYYSLVGGSDNQVNHLEARWIKESVFNDLVEETWPQVGSNPNLVSVHAKLNRMHDMFHDWDPRVPKKSKKRLRKAQRDLEKIMTGPMNDEKEEKRKELSEQIEFLLELEEIHYM
ncbi:hypothetical protein VPH35_001773 [Triticum aestivum]